ncbi:MAG: metallophosphoesterase [Deltaproteobacteria bacterium]|nr:metallophosphoesterase [Deltaproteobacteria bacterium]
MTRILHVSDLHLEDGFPGVPWKSFANKRLVGLANLRLLRRRLFAQARQKVDALADFAREQGVDLVVCTGDYTALGTDAEIAYARRVIEPLTHAPQGFFTVPGNHDVYLQDAVRAGWFEKHFGEFLRTDLPEYAVDGPWPQVWLSVDGLALIGVNSARPNPNPTLSNGRIPDAQLDALARILDDERVRDRFIIIATHYAPRLANGQPDRPHHGLENADALLEISCAVQRGVIVHGHVHRRYHVWVAESHLPLCCAGSTTHEGREGLWVFDVEEHRAVATPGRWDQLRYILEPDQAFEIFA